jgi:adenosine deaminase
LDGTNSSSLVNLKKTKRIYFYFFLFFSDVYHANGIAKNFQEFLTNLFKPLFDATIDPQSHPDLFRFMHHLTGFDSVDDETKPERPIITNDMPHPDEWNTNDNPSYAYYLVRRNSSEKILFEKYFSFICMRIYLH